MAKTVVKSITMVQETVMMLFFPALWVGHQHHRPRFEQGKCLVEL